VLIQTSRRQRLDPRIGRAGVETPMFFTTSVEPALATDGLANDACDVSGCEFMTRWDAPSPR